jgi:quercetin dioxygenase-like cupin family protein
MRSRLSIAGSMLILGAALAAASVVAQPQDEKVVPVHEEPRHHLVFDSPAARVLDIQIPPGDTTLFHTHSNPILYVNMSSSQTRSQTLGQEWSGGEAARPTPRPPSGAPLVAGIPPAVFGRMNSVTSYSTQSLTHRVNNVGTGVFRLIGIINRTDGDASTAASADFASTPEVDNRWLRGYRSRLNPTAVKHLHANPTVIVLVRGRAVVNAGKELPLDALGAFAFIEGGLAHSVKGEGAEPNEIVEIEVRRPRS